MRQFSGFATPEETNRRYHYLLEQGQTGLSVAFDLPTLMGYDADHALSEGEVGKCGVAISSLEDMEILFRGIPLGDVTVSMTINSPAAVLWAMYLAVAEQQGVRLGAALRHAAERHPEGVHRAEGVHLPAARLPCGWSPTPSNSARGTRRASIPISISGYHIREAGSTAVQELAFTLRDGIEYVDWALERGLADRRFRAAPELLLQRPQRFLRGDRQVPRGAQDLGARHARPLRRARRAQPEAALPRADRGLLAHLAAALQQRGAHRACRPWPRCWAARNRCTPIRSTKPTRCPASTPSPSRCAPSRCWPTKAAWPTRPIRWAAATSWKS